MGGVTCKATQGKVELRKDYSDGGKLFLQLTTDVEEVEFPAATHESLGELIFAD